MMSTADTTRPERKRPSICHSCKATVVWVLLDGKRQPLDWLPAGGGNVALEPELPGVPRAGDQLARARVISGVTTHYRRHIESCPDADKWRATYKRRGIAGTSFTRFDRKKTR